MSESGSGNPVDSSTDNDKAFSCPDCGNSYDSLRGLNIHRGKTHGRLKRECETCHTEFGFSRSKKDSARFCSAKCRDRANAKRKRKQRVELTCEECGSVYEKIETKKEQSRFCSQACLHEYRRNRDVLSCDNCGESYEVIASRSGISRYCSPSCMYNNQTGLFAKEDNPMWNGGKVALDCDYCGSDYKRKAFLAQNSRFCSRECKDNWASDYKVGENSVNWKGGVSNSYNYGKNYEERREMCLERDNHTCQDCGTTENLHVHHIRPIRTFDVPEEANALLNLVTLCATCHLSKWEGIPLRPDTR